MIRHRRQDRKLRRLKLRVRARIKRSPALYIPLARIRNGTNDGVDLVKSTNPEAVRRDTELVLEAAGSSGNTFAVIAFRMAQARPVSIAHHLHAAAQIKRGVKTKTPTLVIIRNPRDVATSRVSRHPPITLDEALREWCEFYDSIDDLPGVLFVDFKQVTDDFGAVVDRVNDTFDTTFRRFDHSEQNVQRVFEIMDEVYRLRGGGNPRKMVARPVPERDARRPELIEHYLGPELACARRRAEEIYYRLTPVAAV